MKTIFRIMFVAFLAVGISSAALILYGYYLEGQKEIGNVIEIDLIKRDQAQGIALAHGNWTPELLTNKETTLKLIHIKNDGFAFSVDEKTLQDKDVFMQKFGEYPDGQYIWLVQVTMQKKGIDDNNREWSYVIDAKNGTVLQSFADVVTTFEPTDPEESIAQDGIIRQAQGDVSIVFPPGVANHDPPYSPFVAHLVISHGDVITWTNNDETGHTVTSISADKTVGQIFDSGLISPGDSFSYGFEDQKTGTYDYACTVHPWMNGAVIVQERPTKE